MKRKFLVMLFAAIATFCMVLGLAGCDLFGGRDADTHVHNFTDYVYNNDATCTADGTETGKCSCGETDTRTKKGSALGHKFENYVPKESATCTEDGTETAKCVRCDATDTRTVKGTKLGHDTEFHAGTATCTEAGTLDYWRCSRCNKDFIDEEGTAEIEEYETDVPLGHEFTVENKCV